MGTILQAGLRKVNPSMRSVTADPPAAQRRSSLLAVLEIAWASGPFTATDAMTAGLTRSTTIDVLDELRDRGLLRELPNSRAAGEYSKGRPSRRFELHARAGVVVGMDAGAGHLTTVVADLRGATLVTRHRTADNEESAESRRATVAAALDDALAAAGRSRSEVVALCVGVPAPVDARGESPPHRTGFWRRMNPGLLGMLAESIPIVRVENDALLAAVAERTIGAAIGVDDVVTLLGGDRLGAGIVVDGHLLRGAHGGVGEMVAFDHVPGVESADGLSGRLADRARTLVEEGLATAGGALAAVPAARIDAPLVVRLAREGDADALAVVRGVAAVLAEITAVFGSLFDPARVVVTGGVAAGADLLIAQARGMMPAQLDLPAPELVASELGAEAVVAGAVFHAVHHARAGALDLPAFALPAAERSLV
ncbi:ROK family protein [Microcella daejeonensis]|uniref:ROK family protein n=1 Tax=Microcella daejeonensis TaxID=2994971 RepID=A0A9E8MMW1_9MICO|nr:ROK family protein [Microcella daejeonensis]WAB82585.1 ROK family protein [Microcella daejeonensis]